MGKSKILIVEDEAIIAMEIEANLKQLGYDVVAVTDTGEDAIEKAGSCRPDIVLMDIRLKGQLDGIEASFIIKSKYGVPIVFLTAYLDENRLKRAKLAIPFGYILKPVQERDLKVTIEMALFVAEADAERRKVAQKLKESEEKFKTAFKTSPDAVNINTLEGKYIDINDGFTQLTGFTEEDALGTLSSELDIWAVPEDRQRLITELKEHGYVVNLESKFKCKDGSYKIALMSARLLSLNNAPHILSITKDISERKEAEQILKVSEQKLRIRNEINQIFLTCPDEQMYKEVLELLLKLMNSEFGTFGYFGPDGIFFVPALSRKIYWDKCNVPDKEIIFSQGKFGGIFDRAMAERKALISNQGPFKVPMGHIAIKNTIVAPVIFRNKLISGIHLANKSGGYDETDKELLSTIADYIAPVLDARLQRNRQEAVRLQVEKELVESEKRYRELVENSILGVLIIQEGRRVFANQALASMIGYSVDELIGFETPVPSFVHIDDADKIIDRINGRLSGQSFSQKIEFRIIRKDSTMIWVEGQSSMIDYKGKPALQVILNDISKRKTGED